MQEHDHRLVAIRPLLAQHGIEALAVRAEGAEGLTMPGDQLTPVIRRRLVRSGHQANAASITQGSPASVLLTCLYWKVAISHPAASSRRRR